MKRLFIVFAFALFFSSCAVEKIVELFSDGREIKSPEWDLDYEVPILGKQIKMSEFVDVKEFLKEFQHRDEESIEEKKSGLIYMKLDPITLNSSDLSIDSKVNDLLGNKDPLTWPLPVQIYQTPNVIESSFPSIKMDMDKDDIDDIALDHLSSSDGYLKIEAKIFIIDSNSPTEGREAAKEEYFVDGLPVFAISKMLISDKEFLFDEATYDEENKCLAFIPKGFLSDNNSKLSPVLKDPTDPKCTDYVFKFELPENALSVRGKGFDLIENLMEQNKTRSKMPKSTTARNITRSRAELSPDDIKAMIEKNGGGVEGLESVITKEGLSVKDIADAYQESGEGINDLLEDMGNDVSISDVLGSDIVTENVDELKDLVKDYDLGDGTTLQDVADVGNLEGLTEFCSFHKTHNIKGLKVVFSVEIDLGNSFVIVGKFIHDFRAVSLAEGDAKLPLSGVGKILKEIKINANMNNTFSFPVDIKNARIKDDSGNETPMMFDGEKSNFRLQNNVNKKCEITFSKPISEMTDSDLLLDVIIPEGSSCAISMSTDFMLDMNIIATGNADVKTDMFK